MLLALVSGMKKIRKTRHNALSHISSQIGQVHGAVNPPRIGAYWTA